VRQILSVGSPEKIVLFGSWARGQARPDSDLDLLIIEESDLPRYRRAGRYRMALLGLFPAKDMSQNNIYILFCRVMLLVWR
jgi:uncharacterized protein